MTIIFVAALATAAAAQPAAARPLYVRAGKLLDVRGGRLLPDTFITIEGDRIARVSPAAETRCRRALPSSTSRA